MNPQTEKPKGDHIRRVGIVFSGGPAPGANAVISAAALSFLDVGRQVIGFYEGFEHLQYYHQFSYRLLKDIHYKDFSHRDVTGIRNQRGIIIGTSRANPGKGISQPEDLNDERKTQALRRIYTAFLDLELDALITIGGDDTLKTANYLVQFQKRLPPEAKRIRIIHLPKTIDNDYRGIDFTFGYFTAVDVMAKEMLNLRADAQATNSYFIVESMGRKAGWLSYGVGIAGEANLIVSVEDIEEELCVLEEVVDPETGKKTVEKKICLDAVVNKIVDMMINREEQYKKRYGTVVLAEGLAEIFPKSYIDNLPRDEHGHISIGKIDIGRLVAAEVEKAYKKRTGQKRKVVGVQMGYEARCASPHAFDIMLGSQLGIGAYRALVEENLDAHMVSVAGQLELTFVPFDDLINQQTLLTEIRFIRPGSDFHRLARFLESKTEKIEE